jgi:hypothetical protein
MNNVGKDASISSNAAALLHAVSLSRAYVAPAWRAMAMGPAVPHGACMHVPRIHPGLVLTPLETNAIYFSIPI